MKYLTTKELADLLRIKERKVYDLAASGDIPCTRATGKLLFSQRAIEEWLGQHSFPAPAELAADPPVVFLGSHDPLLEWSLRQSQCGIAVYFDGSLDGLDRFDRREGVATGLHVYDAEEGVWNVPFVAKRFSGRRVVLVQWVMRQRGLILAPHLDGTVQDIGGLAGLTLVPRQSESGTNSLASHLLQQAGLDADKIKWAEPARTEVDAALSVADGKADATLGLQSVARQYRLPFVPLVEEPFDILVCRRQWFEEPFQKFMTFCQSPEFAARATEMGGYDTSRTGTVRFNL